MQLPRFVWRLIRFPRLLYAIGLGPIVGRIILLLTTTGRKSGRRHVIPLQYEEVEGVIYVGSARGEKADWYRNILANPRVEVRMKSRRFHAEARAVTDFDKILSFLELRLKRHPRMIGRILRMQGFPANPSRAQLEEYARKSALVAIYPNREGDDG